MSSFFIPAIAITLLLLFFSPAPTVAGIVYDAEGEMLQNGRLYYILPYEPYELGSGGLSWTPNNSSSCPLFVKPKRYTRGTPASISTLIRPAFVPTSYPVFITFFDTNAPCPEQLTWSVTSGEANDDELYVTAGTSEPIPPIFRIEEADTKKNEYHIKYCRPNEYRIFSKLSVMEECDDVGILENGLLGITPNKPSPFRFLKAFSDVRMPVVRA